MASTLAPPTVAWVCGKTTTLRSSPLTKAIEPVFICRFHHDRVFHWRHNQEPSRHEPTKHYIRRERLISRRFFDLSVQSDLRRWLFKVVPALLRSALQPRHHVLQRDLLHHLGIRLLRECSLPSLPQAALQSPCIKGINYAARKHAGGGTVGWLIRESSGVYVGAFALSIGFLDDSVLLDAMTIKHGIEFARRLGMQELLVEGDV
ncbi:Heat shock cognate 70 kDa protein 1 [Senna tora]|uniref:Heat shock cognate 70 kDa protein 1 n=1 Tax=Senna tora TaxID=362788 RepID=A0A834SRQ6_9FABA|nr:Heat shock cognate 70 kDa protein 1 [Senna tora]